jgi:hypothetical protein
VRVQGSAAHVHSESRTLNNNAKALSVAEVAGIAVQYQWVDGLSETLRSITDSHEVLRSALQDAIWAADFLADQQAMPDDGYVERLERARETLGAS